jgi:hypothetical protein
MVRKPSVPSLEEAFELPEDYLQGPVAAALRPGLVEATDRATGQDCILKFWLKIGTDADIDLRELWRHERLQVERVMSYPGADEVMVGVIGMVETSDAFCVVHEPGTVALHAKLRTAPSRHWLRSLNASFNRVVLWSNLARLAKAIGILHGHGLVHGRIDSFAVFTEGGNTPDFRLGGFEWSLVLGEPRPANPSMRQIRKRIDRLIYSYAEDWKALGVLFGALLGLDPDRLREDDPYRRDATAIELTDGEVDFVRRLVDPNREETLEAKEIVRSVEVLIRELSGRPDTRRTRLILVFRPSLKMGEAIYAVTEGEVATADQEAQASFVEADLASGARLAAPATNGEFDRLFLLTETLSYQIKPYSDGGALTWQVGVIVSILPRTDARLPPNHDVHSVRHPIEVVRNKSRLAEMLGRLRADVLEWTLQISPEQGPEEDVETKTVRQAMLLVQAIDALLKSLEVLPVQIAGVRSENGRTIIQVAPRVGTRDVVAAEIGERSTSDAMDRLFDRDDLGIDVEWRLSTSGGLSSRGSNDTPVRFTDIERGKQGQIVFEFEAYGLLPPESEQLFLRKKGDHGTESLIKRRLRMTKVLSQQRDLVTMFVDPRRRSRILGETLVRDKFFEYLDEPKQEALEALWTTMPTYFVVGPPGVGKTTLLSEIVRRYLSDEPAGKLLISSQSHQALDHVLGAVRKAISGSPADIILVRSPGRDGTVSTDADVRKTALAYLDRVRRSRLLSQAPPTFSAALDSLREACGLAEQDEVSEDPRHAEGVRALNALVLESANLVFSTSTSPDVEQLSDDGAQFDWALVEEAAKASGPDLVAPLSLSGRRLLIGDHNQLPPFDAERITAIISDRSKIRNAVVQAETSVGATFYEAGLDTLRRELEDDDVLNRVTSMAARAMEPFRMLVEEDAERRPVAGGTRRSVSSELLLQHRMDPAIAELISRSFYKSRLETSKERILDAAKPLQFTFGGDVPASPIVFIDMPFVSRTGRAQPIESGKPRWHNPSEAKAIVALLKRLKLQGPRGDEAPMLAVLAPYRAQVERITRQVEAIRADGSGGLSAFRGFTHDQRFCGTVDSSQGSEADIVMVSLVRNNHRTGTPALGFLRDRRRMNVLLSRARQQLVLVGSLEFLRESTRFASRSEDDELAFVLTFLETLKWLQGQKTPRGVTAASIIPAANLGIGRP